MPSCFSASSDLILSEARAREIQQDASNSQLLAGSAFRAICIECPRGPRKMDQAGGLAGQHTVTCCKAGLMGQAGGGPELHAELAAAITA
ncbi:hypothetical protein HaLaN_07585, partial [Haematococcus lacustris]